MARLNISIRDEYLDVINMFKVSNRHEVEKKFEKSDQSKAVQYIILEYMKQNNISNYVSILESQSQQL